MNNPQRTALLAAALASLAGTAGAQQVTLYGSIDTGVERVSHARGDGSALVRVPSITGTQASRVGVRGEEDLGNGAKALFVIENGFNADTGAAGQGGRMWGRQAFVGLSSASLGTLTLGRQYTMLNYPLITGDILGPNLYGLGSLDSYLPAARSDNTLAYRHKLGGLGFGATYSTGRDTVGNGATSCAGEGNAGPVACRQVSAMVQYDTADWGLGYAIDEQRGGGTLGASFYNGAAAIAMPNSSDKDRRQAVTGWAKLAGVKVAGGWIGRRVDTATTDVKSDMLFLGASVPVTAAWTFDGEAIRIVNSDQQRSASMLVGRGVYSFSKRTAVYAQLGWLDNGKGAQYTVSSGGGGTTPTAGTNQLGSFVGMRHTF
ncbi:porin [Derxia gummosa]|uniref:Porin n=1 Tax=Derxia gummosa DSM 723 TaxID=1121388 RepID=A0A8B6X8K1_9BURK|nr:porin [Derxia gummosa]